MDGAPLFTYIFDHPGVGLHQKPAGLFGYHSLLRQNWPYFALLHCHLPRTTNDHAETTALAAATITYELVNLLTLSPKAVCKG